MSRRFYISLIILFVTMCSLSYASDQTDSTQSAASEPAASESSPQKKPVRIVYFSPADCTPFDQAPQRLGRVMSHIQSFYKNGMEANGHGAVTFDLEWTAPNELKLYNVKGKFNQSEYGRGDAWKVRAEVHVAMLEQGMNINQEFVVIFQQALRWEGDQAKEIGPYVGAGSQTYGTAWVFDDPLLDAARLTDKSSGGYYYGPCSVGQFNSHYIGGVAHEMGHMFGLPHDCQTYQQYQTLGSALMGGGNHTYGNNLRGEGHGSFLSASEALRLSKNIAFVGTYDQAGSRAMFYIRKVQFEYKEGKIHLTGKADGRPKLTNIIVYLDQTDIPSDYDALSWTTIVNEDGTFDITLDQWNRKPHRLTIAGLHTNGAVTQFYCTCTLTGDNSDFDSINK